MFIEDREKYTVEVGKNILQHSTYFQDKIIPQSRNTKRLPHHNKSCI